MSNISFEIYHFWWLNSIGLPISELDYPAITICSQGWISSVTQKAMEYQFISYVESTGKNVNELTEQELEEIRNSYLNGKEDDDNTYIMWQILI